jgi:hypothetical protein
MSGVNEQYMAYSNETYQELMEPYNKTYDELDYGNMDPKDKLVKTSIQCDWETAFLITDEGKEKDKQLRYRGYTSKKEEDTYQDLKEAILSAIIEEETMDRTDDILSALSRIESNTQQYSQPAYNHSTWTPSKKYSSAHSPSGAAIHYNKMNNMISKGGKIETDHHRIMNDVKAVQKLQKKQR